MIRRQQLAAIVVAIGLLIGGATSPVAASPVGDLFEGDEDDGLLPDVDAIVAGATGTSDRISAWVDRVANGPSDPEERASNATEAFNSDSKTLVEYANKRVTPDGEERDVLEITFVLGDEEAVRYLVADIDSTTGNYSSAAMLDRAAYEDRGLDDADTDETVELSGFAADNAAEELDTFVVEYAAEDRDLAGSSDLARMTTSYAGSIDASFEW